MSSPTVTSSPRDGWIFVSEGDLHVLARVEDGRRPTLEAAAHEGLVAVLEALSPALSALPDFAIADTSASPTRVLLRGEAYAVSGADTGRAEGRQPWREFDVAGAVELHAPEPAGPRLGWQLPSRFATAAEATTEDIGQDTEPHETGDEEVADLDEAPLPTLDDPVGPVPTKLTMLADDDEPAP
ncbi:MAG TPA: hypothetical protein PKX29_03065, partial [Phycicoccus sp.]|nr:hypothetical protein [Phycicoccus sp.]